MLFLRSINAVQSNLYLATVHNGREGVAIRDAYDIRRDDTSREHNRDHGSSRNHYRPAKCAGSEQQGAEQGNGPN